MEKPENEQMNDEIKKEENTSEKENIKEEPKKEENTEPTDEKKKKDKDKKKERINELESEVATLKDQLLRDRAELENFKKRQYEERVKERKYASMSLVSDLINQLDNLRRVVNMETDNEVLKNFLIGFKMINNQLFDVLMNDGLEEIKSLGLAFDPTIHQAVSTEKKEGVEKGYVLEELQKGYKYKDRVIRPAMVKVSE